MKEVILAKFKEIEKIHNVKIIYGCESGSRGWGFPSMDSDYDARFIYLNPKNHYLSIEEKTDFIECPIDELLDINGWDIKKVLLHVKKSNASILEWFSSPIVYINKGNFKNYLDNILTNYFLKTRVMHHYFHLAFNKFEESLKEDKVKIKTFFYILRPLFCLMWIEKNASMPPMEFYRLLKDSDASDEIKDEIINLLNIKKETYEAFKINKIPVLWKFIEQKINYYKNYLKNMEKDSITGYDRLNEIFRDVLNEEYDGV